MIEICSRLFVGTEEDYEHTVRLQTGWAVVHACKEPYHRQALGYAGRGAPKDHPEYLIARRGERLILNLVDVADPAYVAVEIMDAALAFIDAGLKADKNVLVHCNQGESRGPSIGLLYLAVRTDCLPVDTFEAAETAYRSLYPNYNPKAGMRGFLQLHWSHYQSRRSQ